MEKNVYSIEEVFAGKFFNIPDYQRGFAWEQRHCEDLLNDLELLPQNFNHYTGTVVFHPNGSENQDNEGSQYKGFDIVDGQQRITSIVILLLVIRQKFSQSDTYKTLANGIEKKYLFATRLSDRNLFYKLTLNSDCMEYFKQDILGSAGVSGQTILSHQRLLIAKQTFNDYLNVKERELGESFYVWLIDYYNKITEKLKVGIYVVDSAAEVGVIFEVMNNRGKYLTELEKAKNYLLYLTTKIDIENIGELVGLINKTWSNIYQRFMSAGLGTESENQFLRAHWLMYSNYVRKDWDGSNSIKAKFNLNNYHLRDIEFFNDLTSYVTSLDAGSIAYADLERPERDNAFNAYTDAEQKRAVVFHSIKLLRTKTIASFRPLLMAVRLKFPKDPSSYLELIKLTEIFAFRVYNLQTKRADTGQSSIFETAYNLFNDEISFETAFNKLRKILYSYSSPSVFNSKWEFNEVDNNWYHWGALKYFLYEYEEYLSGNDPLQLTWSYFSEKPLENSIEHILPQTPNDGENYWPSRFDQNQFRIYIHDLGNLCLTFNNSSYRNHGFDLKKGIPGQNTPCYATSSLHQERILTNYPEWTVDSIKQRRKELTDWAKNRWYVDLDEFENMPINNQIDDNFEENIEENDINENNSL